MGLDCAPARPFRGRGRGGIVRTLTPLAEGARWNLTPQPPKGGDFRLRTNYWIAVNFVASDGIGLSAGSPL